MQMATKSVVFTHSTISPSQQILLLEVKRSKRLIIIDSTACMINVLAGISCQDIFMHILIYFSAVSSLLHILSVLSMPSHPADTE